MTTAIPTDLHDKDGNLLAIEFYDTSGTHLMDAVWDPRDEQTREKRAEFRKWALQMAKRKGYEVEK